MELSDASRIIAGGILLTIVTIQFGGWFLTKIVRGDVPMTDLLMSGGFFASSAGKDRTKLNQFIAILWLGALALAAGVLTLGLGLITA